MSLTDLLADNDSLAGLAVTSGAIVSVAVVLRLALVPLVRWRFRDDPYRRYWSGKIVTYVLAGLALVVLVVVWAPLGGRLSVILGFATAGLAFAMQEVIGALFGWGNILAGRIYTVGDRIQVGNVRGDVVDITPLRTKLLEIGSEPGEAGATWVAARQPTGRVITISNKKTFTEAIYNYSAQLDWIWEELTIAVAQDADWQRAEKVMLEEICGFEPEVRRRSELALSRLAVRYPTLGADMDVRSYIRVAQGDVEITGRFVVGVRSARATKDMILRRILKRLASEGIPVAYPTYAVAVTPVAADTT